MQWIKIQGSIDGNYRGQTIHILRPNREQLRLQIFQKTYIIPSAVLVQGRCGDFQHLFERSLTSSLLKTPSVIIHKQRNISSRKCSPQLCQKDKISLHLFPLSLFVLFRELRLFPATESTIYDIAMTRRATIATRNPEWIRLGLGSGFNYICDQSRPINHYLRC